jgi:DNA-binding SARP family transcriptional activator
LALYEAALAQDPLAENLYRGAIRCHLAAGRSGDALRAYRRCREQLSLVLGVSPSAATSKLVARIAGQRRASAAVFFRSVRPRLDRRAQAIAHRMDAGLVVARTSNGDVHCSPLSRWSGV